MFFLPKSPKIYNKLEELADIIKECGDNLQNINHSSRNVDKLADKIRDLEFKADSAYHKLVEETDSLFITPIDREDIHSLAKNLDDVTDLLEDVYSRFSMYKINKGTKDFKELAKAVNQATTNVHTLIHHLRTGNKKVKQLRILIKEIRSLENYGDDLKRKSVASLFSKKAKAVTILQWKDIYEGMESVLDECETTTNIVNEIIIKNY